MDRIIEVQGLRKAYKDLVAVDNLSFTVEKGKVLGLLGANGAGKSTTLECILGTKTMDQGRVRILGRDPGKERKVLFEEVGVQFQEGSYPDRIKVAELCQMTASLYKHPKSYEKLLADFNLWEKKKAFLKDLSGGERQKLFVLLSMMPDPKVLFLDELTTGLDPRARRSLWEILLELKKKGITMVLTSHYMDEVEKLCDELIILGKGQVLFQGSVEECIKKSPFTQLEDAYLWYTEEGNTHA